MVLKKPKFATPQCQDAVDFFCFFIFTTRLLSSGFTVIVPELFKSVQHAHSFEWFVGSRNCDSFG